MNLNLYWKSLLALGTCAAIFGNAKAEFLFLPVDGNFITPTLDFSTSRYSEWRGFYSTSTVGNLPDWYAEFGGTEVGDIKYPTARPSEFPYYPYYTSDSPNAFWDVNNPTITQTNPVTGHITSGGNFYGISGPQTFKLADNTMATSDPSGSPGFNAGTVVFQFQTDGMVVDLSLVRLVYLEGGVEKYIYATDLSRADWLTEFRPPEGTNGDASSSSGYLNRAAIQWNLTGLDVSQYWIEWETAAHTSFQQVSLDTSAVYTEGIPSTRVWTGGSGAWNNASNWETVGQNSGQHVAPVRNGNLLFQNDSGITVELTQNHFAGEIAFLTEHDVTIQSAVGAYLGTNTGVRTDVAATGTYTIKSDFVLGALSFFEINAGSVVMDGVVSGNYGIVKTGNGLLTLTNNNTYTGFIDVQGGKLRLEGTNSYAGGTSVRWGELIVANDNALGLGASAVKLGAGELFEGIPAAVLALEGDRVLSNNIEMLSNQQSVVISARETEVNGARVDGNIVFNTGATGLAFRAEGVNDVLRLTGTITGGVRNQVLTIDGQGTVVFSGENKTYLHSTTINSGTLVLESSYTPSTAGGGNFIVKNGGTLRVNAVLDGNSTTTPRSVTIENGGVLGGSGLVNRTVVTGGINSVIEGGGAEGSLTLASLNATAGVSFRLNLSESSEPIAISGLFSAGNIQFQLLGDVDAGIAYTLLTYGSATGLNIANFSILNPGYVLDQSFGNGGWLVDATGIQVQFAAIPEPSTWALLGLAVVGVCLLRRRRVC